uniref:Granulins domain-containing protein n=1 Tax=Nothobranchius furzeri TaxID=105023 RepID=A0A8C6Q711_NOTFU
SNSNQRPVAWSLYVWEETPLDAASVRLRFTEEMNQVCVCVPVVPCNDSVSCADGNTCCKSAGGGWWGCCPLPQAVCCQGGNHCCPSGHTCEPHRSTCSRGPNTIAWFTKLSARTEPMDVSDVKCDNKSSCASGTTCCRLPSGEWGCCPLVKAVCCDDHEHCCPQGYSCNMKTSTCEKKVDSLLLTTLPQSEVVRPSAAPTQSTAVLLASPVT